LGKKEKKLQKGYRFCAWNELEYVLLPFKSTTVQKFGVSKNLFYYLFIF